MAASPANPPGLNGKPPTPDKIEPSVVRIRDHYARLGLAKGWRKDRFFRFCKLLSRTPMEVGAMIGMTRYQLGIRLRDGRFSVTETILFLTIEQVYLSAKHGLTYPPIIPLNVFSEEPSILPSHD